MQTNLRQIRLERDIPAQRFMELLGITHPTYYKKELGHLRFSLEEAKKISEFLNMDIDDIFFANQVSKMEQ